MPQVILAITTVLILLATCLSSTTPSVPAPVIFIPSFQGTLLRHPSEHIPLFLSPLTPYTQQATYTLLRSQDTVPTRYVEYPTFVCAPHPFSHIGHCAPIPAKGPVAALEKYINERGLQFYTVPYDWRLTRADILKSNFTAHLSDLLSKNNEATVVVAHGTSCHLLKAFRRLYRSQFRAYCITPIPASVAADTLSTGEGLLTAGGAHAYAHPAINVVKERLDFRSMEHELGLRQTRHAYLPNVSGPWDEGEVFAASQDERIGLAKSFASLTELSSVTDDVRWNRADGICVEGYGHGSKTSGGLDGDGFIGVGGCGDGAMRINATHFDLRTLLDGVLQVAQDW